MLISQARNFAIASTAGFGVMTFLAERLVAKKDVFRVLLMVATCQRATVAYITAILFASVYKRFYTKYFIFYSLTIIQ